MKIWKRTAFILAVVLLMATFEPVSDMPTVSATSKTKEEIDRTEREKDTLQNELDKTQENLDSLEDKRDSLEKELSYLNSQMNAVVTNLEELERRIQEKEQEIEETLEALEEAKATEEWQQASMEAMVRCMYERQEDNYLTTDDAITSAHTVLASQFLNEAFALKAGLPEEQMGLGHAFEIDPDVENGFLYELAQAEMAREIFPNAPLKYMPPTKFMTGNVFRGHVQDALFNMVTILTGQKIHLLGMMTEAIHTPFMSDRALAIENAQYIFRTMKDLGAELTYKEGGIIQSRANEVLTKATALLAEIEELGLFTTIERGIFADVKRPKEGGKGLAGVAVKGAEYFNPFIEEMKGKVAAQ